MLGVVTLQSGGTVAAIAGVATLVLFVLPVAGMWMMFEKAGEPGWKALLPIYNLWVLVDISGKEWWWFLVLFVPSANLAAWVIVNLGLGDRFGQRDAFGVMASVFFFVVYPLLGFGDYDYRVNVEGTES
jgi:hypothetical protein